MNKKLQRANRIIEILKEKNGASVKDLASTLGVSEMTIRRDLNLLKSNNIVSNVYGATIYNPLNSIEKLNNNYDITDEVIKRENEKIKIGKAAAKLIQNDDIIIIDAGTTTEKLAQSISDDIKLTALFYSINILSSLKNRKNIELIFSGGYFHENTQMFESPEGISLIENMRANKVFVSAAGVHETLGVTCSNNYEVATKRAIISSSVEKILLVDSDKFDSVKSSYFSDLQEFDIVITDHGIPDEWRTRLEDMEIQVIIA
ncbi:MULTISPECIES: DeoR/GlpR family DNA-binding transcription regulator [Clostridium]|uniref:Deoxyribose operon repressor n=2 Tax=Clostridium TaxID=1485 RepID=B2TL85_CLOBB|nr:MULTISPECIES: DeoR/GlpR family DNA-binding transcription regulator [unclassified Clostridium]ACD23076.1 deoxyribose operon repressor [Clostridium botulinum B str. Eklund 17B (NRP)]MBN1037710.1 DeoR/GlpR transcriptional regulator [Clostridium botulinum]MBY6976603.1 DeoR/GlpR transcriptional regulator [Clostridium botulinum]MBY7001464.1 DeoR/GlpR transcriptional regulator [Clostridium botulinum]MCR1274301.1 DeoR/GlpR family DNA-binding transcription regulator [Clostridium botulinum]